MSQLRALSCKSPRSGTSGPPAPARLSGRPQEREIQGRGCPGGGQSEEGSPPRRADQGQGRVGLSHPDRKGIAEFDP